MASEQTKSQTKLYLLNTVKLLVMVVLAGVVVLGAFVSGAVFQRLRTPQRQNVTLAAPTLPPVTIPTEEEIPGFNVFWEAWGIVQSEFYSDVPVEQERVYGAIRGMVNTYGDENTAFIDPTRAALLQEDASGSFEGIGAAVQLDELGRLVIAEPFTGRPAAEAGILRGDVVLEVDGQSLRGLSLYESVALIRGKAGSTVALTILREGTSEPFEIEVVRAKIEIEVVEADLLEGNIGYLRLSE
ncbi:MAG: S41 family peptidase, partial [Anaerolineae bacterium]